MPRVVGLGHIGLYVRDLERMTSFYKDFLGMQITKQAPGRAVFLSSDPERVDHEIALMTGRPTEEQHLIQQISLRVNTLDDLREFKRLTRDLKEFKPDKQLKKTLRMAGELIATEAKVNVAPYSKTVPPSIKVRQRKTSIMIGIPIDIDRPDDEILSDIDRVWEQTRHVAVGEPPDAAAVAAMDQAYRKVTIPAPALAR